MRRGLHRKRIPVLGRGPKTRGTGFKYVNEVPPGARERTAEDVAAKELKRQQQAVLEEGRRFRQWNVITLVGVAEKTLRAWKVAADRNDQRLREFPGWTTADFCTLPVDQEVAELYEDEFYDYVNHHWGRPLSLAEMDAIVNHAFHSPRVVSTAQTITDATTVVRHAAEKCCDNEGISFDRFIEILDRRAVKAKQNDFGVTLALVFVRKEMSSLFERLCTRQAVEDKGGA